MKALWLGLVLGLAVAPAQAGDAPKKDGPRVVCTKERTTGSNIRRRNCMTQAQQEERRKRDQEAMQRMKSAPRPNDVSS